MLTPTPVLWGMGVFPVGFPAPSSVPTPSSFTSEPPALFRLLSRLLHVYMNMQRHERGVTQAVSENDLKHWVFSITGTGIHRHTEQKDPAVLENI